MNTKRNNKKRKNRGGNSPIYRNIASYPGQPLATHTVRSYTNVLTTTVTSGQIAVVYQLGPSFVTNWATRFASLYEEFRLMRVNALIQMFSSQNPGVLLLYWDEKTTTVPNNAAASERVTRRIAAADISKTHRMSWKAKDTVDLAYTATSGSDVPVCLMVFTNNANNGSSIVATPYASISFELVFQFRGFAT
jgi:hypothetical protein